MEECFYKLTVTKDKPVRGSYYFEKKSDVWHLGYLSYKEVMQHVEDFYKRGADAVEMEMISQTEFDKEMETYYVRQ